MAWNSLQIPSSLFGHWAVGLLLETYLNPMLKLTFVQHHYCATLQISCSHWLALQVWDHKYPLVIIPGVSMRKPSAPRQQPFFYNPLWYPYHPIPLLFFRRLSHLLLLEVKDAAHRHVARLVSWSMEIAASGVWPAEGYHQEELSPKTLRGKLAGEPLARGWRTLVFPAKELF